MSAARPIPPDSSARIAQRVRAHASAAISDGSVVSLVIANLLAITIARHYGMSLRDLIFVYWLQSVIIGVAHAVRILSLKDYSKTGYNNRYGRPIDTSDLGKVNFALQFILVYFPAHAIAFVLIALDIEKQGGPGLSIPPSGELLACGLAFAADQVYSTARKIRLDRQGRPRIASMMSAPFMRILPMHMTILVGGLSFGRDVGVLWWLFAGLKTIVDVVMQVRDRHTMQDALVEKRGLEEEGTRSGR